MQNRFYKIRNILIFVLVLNWLVAAAKIIYGYISKSTAMSADGFHSFSDGASNLIGLIGIWVASQPVDKDHPYGHKKYETFTAIVISIVLFVISFNIIRGGIARFLHPVIPDVTAFSFIVMFFTLAVNCWVVIYERKFSKDLKSDILAADAQHTRSDILVSISVIFTLLAVRAGFPIIDTIASLVIALFIARGAVEILRESSAVLCDQAAGVSEEIKDIVSAVEGVRDCHKIRTRGRPDDIQVDLHVLVNQAMHVDTAHRLADTIEKAVKDKISGVTDIIVHVEPDRQTGNNH